MGSGRVLLKFDPEGRAEGYFTSDEAVSLGSETGNAVLLGFSPTGPVVAIPNVAEAETLPQTIKSIDYRSVYMQGLVDREALGALAQAASFDPGAVERAARVAAVEASAHGLHWTFAPMVDVARDPRWGRIVEGAGEDPYLGEVLAAAQVRGYQGEDLAAEGALAATAKHFVAYGAAEAGRDYNTVDVSERALREVYLPPFLAAVRAGVASVMPAFNEIAGVPMHAHAGLIEGVLRGEWGWEGVVVSDYTGVMELLRHGVAGGAEEAGLLALRAGVDVDLVSDFYLGLAAAVREGRLEEAVVDRSADAHDRVAAELEEHGAASKTIQAELSAHAEGDDIALERGVAAGAAEEMDFAALRFELRAKTTPERLQGFPDLADRTHSLPGGVDTDLPGERQELEGLIDEAGREDTSSTYFVVENGQASIPDFDHENPVWVEEAMR